MSQLHIVYDYLYYFAHRIIYYHFHINDLDCWTFNDFYSKNHT